MPEQSRVLVIFSTLLFVALCFTDLAIAQMTPIYRFKGINVPVRLKIKDKIMEKGAYDLEFLRTSSPVLYYIKIMKGGKILGILQGEEWPYAHGIASDIAFNLETPSKPTLKMAMNKTEKLFNFIFESGRNAAAYPLIRAKFKMPYEE
jgi:hypothetical protein